MKTTNTINTKGYVITNPQVAMFARENPTFNLAKEFFSSSSTLENLQSDIFKLNELGTKIEKLNISDELTPSQLLEKAKAEQDKKTLKKSIKKTLTNENKKLNNKQIELFGDDVQRFFKVFTFWKVELVKLDKGYILGLKSFEPSLVHLSKISGKSQKYYKGVCNAFLGDVALWANTHNATDEFVKGEKYSKYKSAVIEKFGVEGATASIKALKQEGNKCLQSLCEDLKPCVNKMLLVDLVNTITITTNSKKANASVTGIIEKASNEGVKWLLWAVHNIIANGHYRKGLGVQDKKNGYTYIHN